LSGFSLPIDPRPVSERIFDCVLGNMMASPSNRAKTAVHVQTMTQMLGVPPEDRRACIIATLSRLDALTAEEAARYSYEADQYARWQAAYFGTADEADTGNSSPASRELDAPSSLQASGDLSPCEPTDSPTSRATPSEPTVSTAQRSVRSQRVVASNDSTAAIAAPTRVESFINRANTARRQLMTPARIATSTAVGTALSFGADHVIGHGPTWMITAPLAAIPSLYFLNRDNANSDRPLDGSAFSAALLGGAASVAVGKTAAAALQAFLV
jgi:hypothetical protein